MSINEALHNTTGLWLRQLSDCAEPDFAAVLDTIQQFIPRRPVLYQKVMDGTTFQGAIDPKTPLTSIAGVAALRDLCVARGAGFVPVIVPRGTPGEAAAHAELAAEIDVIQLDLEDGPGFWDRGSTALIPAYCDALRNAAPNAYLISQPDPRSTQSVYLAETAASFDAVAAQHYVGDTADNWTNLVQEVARFDAIRALGLACIPTLYGEGDWAIVDVFWRAVRTDCLALQAFRFGAMNADQLRQLGALQFANQDTDPATQLRLAQVTGERDTLRAAIERVRSVVTGL